MFLYYKSVTKLSLLAVMISMISHWTEFYVDFSSSFECFYVAKHTEVKEELSDVTGLTPGWSFCDTDLLGIRGELGLQEKYKIFTIYNSGKKRHFQVWLLQLLPVLSTQGNL